DDARAPVTEPRILPPLELEHRQRERATDRRLGLVRHLVVDATAVLRVEDEAPAVDQLDPERMGVSLQRLEGLPTPVVPPQAIDRGLVRRDRPALAAPRTPLAREPCALRDEDRELHRSTRNSTDA